jgi:hypothetical protein
MNKEMLEALRLTREGRLAEAQEIIGRATGRGDVSRGTHAYVLEPLRIQDVSGTGAEQRDPKPPPVETTQPGEAAPEETKAGVPPVIPVEPSPNPTPPPVIPKGTSARIRLRPDFFAKLAAQRPGARQVCQK